jgi:hypothetical protein
LDDETFGQAAADFGFIDHSDAVYSIQYVGTDVHISLALQVTVICCNKKFGYQSGM